MSRLLLLRHAKAGWAAPGMRDFDRPLDETGRQDSEAIGAVMARANYRPDLVLCSSAVRARETLDGVNSSVTTPTIRFLDGLYATDAGGYLELIQSADGAETVLVVGHNPMMEDVGIALPGDGDAAANDMIAAGFPTAGLAVIRFDGPMAGIAPGTGYLEAMLVPPSR
ncbi:MAG: histidine phosphatase family protein [Rhizobiaceae bacterium]